MRLFVFVTTLITALMLAGCPSNNSSPKEESAAKSTTSEPPMVALRSQLQNRPEVSTVGIVLAVLPDMPWINVGDMPVDSVKEHELMTIMSPEGQVLATAQVATIVKDTIHAFYQSKDGQRKPRPGDLVVKFK